MVNTYLRMFLLLKGVYCIVPQEGYESRDPLMTPTFRIGIRESPQTYSRARLTLPASTSSSRLFLRNV